jgi:hypothetical protein
MPRTRNEPFLLNLQLLRDRVPDWSVYPFNIPAVAKLEAL